MEEKRNYCTGIWLMKDVFLLVIFFGDGFWLIASDYGNGRF